MCMCMYLLLAFGLMSPVRGKFLLENPSHERISTQEYIFSAPLHSIFSAFPNRVARWEWRTERYIDKKKKLKLKICIREQRVFERKKKPNTSNKSRTRRDKSFGSASKMKKNYNQCWSWVYWSEFEFEGDSRGIRCYCIILVKPMLSLL